MSILSLYLVLLIAIPAGLTFPAFGAAGRPAQLFGLLMLAWWGLDFLTRSSRVRRPASAVRLALASFLFAMGLGYLQAVTRPISGLEISSTDRGLLLVLSLAGVFLAAADAIPNRARLDDFLFRLSIAVALFALLGLMQFATGRVLINMISIPGLGHVEGSGDLGSRGGFFRPSATALHPIEFGAVLGVGLAIVLHVAMYTQRGAAALRWGAVVLVGLAIGTSGSRSAYIGAGLVMAMMVPAWPRRVRHNSYVLIILAVTASVVLTPSFLRSMFELFAGGPDDSVASRTDSYDLVFYFISRYPLFGRGLGTLLSQYRIMDNQYLGTWIETGTVGVLSLAGLSLCGVVTAEAARRRSPDVEYRQLGRALSAAVVVSGISWLFYDGMGFPINAGTAFLALGLVASLHRIQA
ncbi:MAG: O-antigen ligase family protein, partial [Candidatus Nanopelagicales bacterium]